MDSNDALDQTCARLVRAGSRVSPHQQGSRRSVFATDPDGHAFEAFHDAGAQLSKSTRTLTVIAGRLRPFSS